MRVGKRRSGSSPQTSVRRYGIGLQCGASLEAGSTVRLTRVPGAVGADRVDLVMAVAVGMESDLRAVAGDEEGDARAQGKEGDGARATERRNRDPCIREDLCEEEKSCVEGAEWGH